MAITSNVCQRVTNAAARIEAMRTDEIHHADKTGNGAVDCHSP
jgi:hypothetical protein